MPTVINRHHYGVRKGLPPLPEPNMYVGRGTPLGNPYSLDDFPGSDRTIVLEMYKRWLWDKIKAGDAAVLGAMRKIRPETHLVCSCYPKTCHADVIVKAWDWLRERGFEPPPPRPRR
jgi:hypothetical protein